MQLEIRIPEVLPVPSLFGRTISATAYASTGRLFVFDSATGDADPGAGKLRLNNASAASATAAYIDNLDFFGAATPVWLDSFDDAGSATHRGLLHIEQRGNQGNFADYRVTGSVVDGTGYRKLTLAFVGGNLVAPAGMVLSGVFFGRGADGVTDAVLATRTDIATYNPAVAPDWLWTLGYAALGDGGGGLWLKKASEPGSIGVPGFFKKQIASGTWYELYTDGRLDLRAAGYVADNATDNGPIITAAAAWLGAKAPGGKLIVPCGMGKCTTVPVIEHSGLTLEGIATGSSQNDGGSTISLAIAAAGAKMLIGPASLTRANVIEIRNLRVIGSGGAGKLFQTRGLRDVRIANLTFLNDNGGFLDLGDASGPWKTTFAFIHEVEGNCAGAGLTSAIGSPNFSGGIDWDKIEIEGPPTPIVGSVGYEIPLAAIKSPDGQRIVNCIFGKFDIGMKVTRGGGGNFICSGVQLDRCGTTGIDITLASGDLSNFQFADGHIVGLRVVTWDNAGVDTAITLTTSNGSLAATISSVAQLVPGMFIEADNVAPGTTIASITDSTHIQLSTDPGGAAGTDTSAIFWAGGNGVKLDRGANELFAAHFIGNHIKRFAKEAFLVTLAADFDFSHNILEDNAAVADNVYDVIKVAGVSTRYVMAHNQVRNRSAPNNSKSGINLAGTGVVRNVTDNLLQGYKAGNPPMIVATRGSLVTDIRRGNTGDGPKGSFVLGPFTASNLADTASVLMNLELAAGSFAPPPMARAGCVVGITVRSNAARTAGTATFSAAIGGTPDSSMQAILNGSNTTTRTATSDAGIPYNADQVVQPNVATASFAPTTADVVVYLHCKDD